MNDSRVDDRRDVAHSTNPIDGHDNIAQDDPGRPVEPRAGQQSAIAGLPRDEGSHPIPPARTGKASGPKAEAETRGRTANSGGADRIDPATRIPEPVTQDLGFRRNTSDGER